MWTRGCSCDLTGEIVCVGFDPCATCEDEGTTDYPGEAWTRVCGAPCNCKATESDASTSERKSGRRGAAGPLRKRESRSARMTHAGGGAFPDIAALTGESRVEKMTEFARSIKLVSSHTSRSLTTELDKTRVSG